MSNVGKRNAETAFEGDVHESPVPSKPKRPRPSNQSRKRKIANALDDKGITASKFEEEKTAKTSAQLIKHESNTSSLPRDEGKKERAVVVKVIQPKQKNEGTENNVKSQPEKTLQKGNNHTRRIRRHAKSTLTSWSLSPASGGLFINHDPVLTTNGKFLVLPTKDRLQVYSVSTSLLVRSIFVQDKHLISSCIISSSNPLAIVVATYQGLLAKFDIATGKQLGQWTCEKYISQIRCVAGKQSSEVLLGIKTKSGEEGKLYLMELSTKPTAKSTVVFSGRYLHDNICSSVDGAVIAVHSLHGVHIGYRDDSSSSKYMWFSQEVNGRITCLDLQVVSPEKTSKRSLQKVNLVVGTDIGQLFVFEDILAKLIQRAKTGRKGDVTGRRLHWHRYGVRSVKWSKDGKYLISGGDETVLVLWQLETNQQQFLPHLSTSILNITISSTGAEYVLRLGDNSVMILSTADLTPSTNVVGLSMPMGSRGIYPMQTHPLHPNWLLAAIPIRVSKGTARATATHLQTYDIDTNVQISRQALTRNLTTTVSMAPNGLPLEEPDITHLQISFDGRWMATVEKWCPSKSNMQALHLAHDEIAREIETETLLRFWGWNEEAKSWEIIARIEGPHTASQDSVLGLASNPVSAEFATVGQDGVLKIWQPRRRIRDGVQVRNKDKKALFNWVCARSIEVEKSEVKKQPLATLTYSEDGSIIAASVSNEQRQVHVVRCSSGDVTTSLPNLLQKGDATLIIRGRSLLCLSSTFVVFDLITFQTIAVVKTKANSCSRFLAFNTVSSVVAIGENMKGKEHALVSLLDLSKPNKSLIREFQMSNNIQALLVERSGRGFIVIDTNCNIQKIVPPLASPTSSIPALKIYNKYIAEQEKMKTIYDIFSARDKATTLNNSKPKMVDQGNAGETSRNLKAIFNPSSTKTAQMSVDDLFDTVSRAVAGTQVVAGA